MRFFLLLISIAAFGQSAKFEPPRQADGHPDLQGVWRNASIVAAFNVEGQKAYYNEPGGASVIVDPPDGKLPYLRPPFSKRMTITSIANAIPPDIAIRMECRVRWCLPFRSKSSRTATTWSCFQRPSTASASFRWTGDRTLKNYHAWAGDSRGRWEGDTLVVDVTGFNGKTWLDQSGNFVDENEHVVERFTMTAPDTIVYEARVEDPTVYSRPWTLRVSLRRQPKGTELIEYDCIEGERDEIHFPGAANKKH